MAFISAFAFNLHVCAFVSILQCFPLNGSYLSLPSHQHPVQYNSPSHASKEGSLCVPTQDVFPGIGELFLFLVQGRIRLEGDGKHGTCEALWDCSGDEGLYKYNCPALTTFLLKHDLLYTKAVGPSGSLEACFDSCFYISHLDVED